ncbi:hypothetical protein Aperf_G00000072965 [Anoplocephala perfoliata]
MSRIKEERKESRIAQANFQEMLESLSADLLHEVDARKLAIMDLNHLRNEYSDLLEYTKELSSHAIDGGDTVSLKIALERARDAHTQALNRIAYLESEYSDVVPKKEFEAVQTNLTDTRAQFSRLKDRCTQLESQLTAKTEELTSTLKERNELSEKLGSMQRVSTPRPEWSRVAQLVPGGLSRWHQLTTGKSSQEKLAVLLSELAGGSQVASLQSRMDSQNLKPIQSPISIIGFQTQKKVPKFLEGCLQLVPRLKPKRDTLLLLEDIWLGRQKQLADYLKGLGKGERPKLPSFNDYLCKYLKSAFGVESIRKEWSLSTYAAGDLMTECEEIVRFRKIIDNEMDEAYHWYLHSLTGRLFNKLRELANAIAITLTMSTKPKEATDTTAPETSNLESSAESSAYRFTTYQLSLVLAKLLDCEPQHPSVIRLVQAALVDSNEKEYEDSTPMAAIPMDDVISLEDLFQQSPGEPLPYFAHALVSHLEQGRKAIIDHIIVEIQRQKSSEGVSAMVTPNDVLEAMKIVRPELESIIASSPSCFFLLDKRQKSDSNMRNLKSGSADEEDYLAVRDLDETSATREEQALAWSRCTSVNEKNEKNYLVATVHWLFQKDEAQSSATEDSLPLEVVERRLWGANIKPYNRLTAVS